MMDWEKLVKQYRTEAERYKQEAEEAKAELKDFITFSRQIEAELDKELNACNLALSKREKEVAFLAQERDRYKEDAQRIRAEKCSMDLKMNNELQSLKKEKENLQIAVHKLEQKNDDLERELRITAETLKDTEKRLNEELELRALLTTELDSKEELKDRCQRLEDEVRDLKLDSLVKDTKLKNRNLNIDDVVKDAKLSNCVNFKQPNGVAVAHDKSAFRDSAQSKNECDSSAHGINRRKSSTDTNAKGIGSRVNALPPSLASSFSPVIVNLLETIQALEEKLLLLHPERRAGGIENGLRPTNRH